MAAVATASAQSVEKKQVTSTEIEGQKVQIIGLLGKPLGDKIQIAGVAPSRPAMMSNPIEVSGIDGKKLNQTIQIEVNGQMQIENGFSYTIVGYESGAFNSAPDWTTPPNEPAPQQNFQFKTFFIPVKVIEKKKL